MTGIIAKLTLRHLAENKKRTVVTVLGVAASTALITAILLGICSFFIFIGNMSGEIAGRWNLQIEDIESSQIENLKNDNRVATVGVLSAEQEVTGVMIDGDSKLRYRTANILQGNDDYFAQMITCDYDGVLPKDSGEIAVEESFLKENSLDLSVGDSLEFDLGNRYLEDLEGNRTIMGGSWSANEKFEVLSHEKLKITAILHGNRPTNSFKLLRGMVEGEYPGKMFAYVSLKKFDHKTNANLRKIIAEYGLKDCSFNTEYNISAFAFEGAGSGIEGMFRVMAFALLIVVMASVVLIYNAFGMSLTERIRYLGMLASVGATKRQKRASVFFEGFILGLMGIPLGMIIGAIGSKITLGILGKMMLDADMFAGAKGMRGTMELHAPIPALVAIVILSGFTIFISSIVPAIKASKIMPIEALRETNNIKLKAGSLKGGFLARKIFGYEGQLAYKNIKRNGRKGKVIIASIAISVALFLTIDYFGSTFRKAYAHEIEYPFSVVAACALSEKDSLKEDILGLEGVESVHCGDTIEYCYKENKDDPAWRMPNTDIRNPEFLEDGYTDVFEKSDQIFMCVLDDEEFKRVLGENGLSADEYFGDELKGVILNNFYHEESNKPVFKESMIGQKLFYDNPEGMPPEVKIAGFVNYKSDDYVFKLVPEASVAVYVPESVFYKAWADKIGEENVTYTYGITCENHEEVHDKLFEILENDGYTKYSCSDLTQSLVVMNTVMVLLKTVIYGFTVLLALVVIANIVNTISTGVMLRRKEFAMLRSVGMASSGFSKMLILETLLYGVRALILGLPGAALLSLLIYKGAHVVAFPFRIDLLKYFLVVVAVFAIVGLSMLLSSAKIKDDNIIEALKGDMV